VHSIFGNRADAVPKTSDSSRWKQEMMMENEDLKISERFRDKVAGFPESSYGVNRIKIDLANGKRVCDVFVAGDGEIVKVGTKAIKTQADLGFRPDEIVSVMSEIR
jgi:hypothetical protein